MSETVQLTNRDLWRMYVAAKTLGNRRMGNVGADLKLARILRFLGPLVEPLETVKQQAVKEILEAAPRDASGLALSVLNLKASEVQAAIDAETVAVTLPLQFALKESDLPKRRPDTEDDPNGTGLGALLADLGPFFLLSDEGATP